MDNKQDAVTKESQVPEWEHTATHGSSAPTSTKHSLLSRISAKLKAAMSSTSASTGISSSSTSSPSSFSSSSNGNGRKRWCGLSKWMLIVLFLGFLLIVAGIIIGVVVGLSRAQAYKDSVSQSLPLPGNTQTYAGQLTYYATSLGACGEYSGDSDSIVSISHLLFDAAGSSSATGGNSNNNPLCNRMLRATRYDSAAGQQRTVDLKVVDRCTGCDTHDLDTSIGVFGQMAAVEQGRVDVSWAWL